MPSGRHIRLSKNGRNQTLQISRENELPGSEAVQNRSLLATLAGWQPLREQFPNVDAKLMPLDDIEF